MHSKMTVGSKISLICAVLVVGMMVQAAVALLVFSRVKTGITHSNTRSVPGIVSSRDLAEDLYLLRGNYMKHILAQTLPEMDAIQNQNSVLIARIDADLKRAASFADSDEERSNLAQVRSLTDTYIAAWAPIQDISRADRPAEATKLFNERCLPVMDKIREILPKLTARKIEEDQTASVSLASLAGTSFYAMIALCLVTVISAALGSFVVIRSINKALRSSVHELGSAAEQIASASSQVASASETLAQAASEQTATVQETSAASHQINSMAQRNVENSRTATEVVGQSQQRAQTADGSLAEMIAAMDRIDTSSKKISKIIKVIDEIAFQTNILALNAAVEAARAGEAGMGFAVVADEVRALAQRSAKAARDTADLIEDSIQQSQDGKSKVDQMAVQIRALTSDTARIKILVDEINQGSVEQSRGVDQISRSLVAMESSIQGNAASAEETSSASQELQAQAQSLEEIVHRLTEMLEGSSDSKPLNPPQRALHLAHAAG